MAIIYGKNACGSCFQLWDCLVAESQINQFDKSQLYHAIPSLCAAITCGFSTKKHLDIAPKATELEQKEEIIRYAARMC